MHSETTTQTTIIECAGRAASAPFAIAAACLAVLATLPACTEERPYSAPDEVVSTTAEPTPAARTPPPETRPDGPAMTLAAWRVERTALDGGDGESVVLTVPTPGGGDGLLVRRTHPARVRAGEPIEYTILVENVSELAMHDIQIKEWRGAGIEIVEINASEQVALNRDGSSNADTRSGQSNAPDSNWSINQLMPGQSETIRVTALAEQEGQVGVCMTVSYEPVVCLITEVVQPELMVRKMIEQNQAFVCDEIEMIYVVENVGSGTAEGVRVVEELPEGVIAADGSSRIEFVIPSLASGEAAEQRVSVSAEQAGVYSSFATANSGELIARTRETPFSFVRPALEMRVEAPAREYVGRDVPMRITLRNSSEWPALQTRLAVPGMGELSRVSLSSQDAPFEGDTILVGRLEPGETRTLELRFAADTPRQHNFEIVADAYCARPVAQSIGVEVLGIAAVRLETVDLVDPVAVGEETVYEIRVKNQGTAESLNVGILALLPDEMTFIAGTGDSSITAEGQQVMFEPIESLAPGDIATWRLRARADTPGRTRLRLEMTSGASRRPIIEQESTTIIAAPILPQND